MLLMALSTFSASLIFKEAVPLATRLIMSSSEGFSKYRQWSKNGCFALDTESPNRIGHSMSPISFGKLFFISLQIRRRMKFTFVRSSCKWQHHNHGALFVAATC